MNFLLHRELARRELGSSTAAVGAMLPDLWRLADRRVRARADVRPAGPLAEGVAHHLEADRWFHGSAVFREGEAVTVRALARLDEPKLGRFGHIAWELCLDGAWLRQRDLTTTLEDLRDDLDPTTRREARALAAQHRRVAPAPERARTFEARMGQVFDRLVHGEWIEGYRHGEGLAERIVGIRTWLGLPALRADSRARLASLLDARVDAAEAALERLWPERERHLAEDR